MIKVNNPCEALGHRKLLWSHADLYSLKVSYSPEVRFLAADFADCSYIAAFRSKISNQIDRVVLDGRHISDHSMCR